VGYRNDLEAAQNRIHDLEQQVRDLKGEGQPPPPPEPDQVPKARSGSIAIFGVPLAIILVVGFCVAGCPMMVRGCGAVSGETEPALAALQRCQHARTLLGDDVGWGMVGCSNCESEGGGDPINGGCHSNATWQMPVSGSKGHGSYTFHFSTPPGGKQKFTGGNVAVSTGERLSIPAEGNDCTVFKQ
jgi:hypothetical protein